MCLCTRPLHKAGIWEAWHISYMALSLLVDNTSCAAALCLHQVQHCQGIDQLVYIGHLQMINCDYGCEPTALSIRG